MKIQCDVCEKAPATIICCADEAALCGQCDLEVHAANKLASKHQRLLLQCLSNKLPRCDICQIGISSSRYHQRLFPHVCSEDIQNLLSPGKDSLQSIVASPRDPVMERQALFCRDCDQPIHVPGSLSGEHQRFLATGIRVALSSACNNEDSGKAFTEPPNRTPQPVVQKAPTVQQASSAFVPSAWAVDEFLQLSDYECSDKKESPIGFGELDWFADIGLFRDQVPKQGTAAAEVPELRTSTPRDTSLYRPTKTTPLKKARIEISDVEDYFTVPDLG